MTLPRRFLVMEDNPADAELLLASLRKSGMEARTEVIHLRDEFDRCMATQHYDLVIADYNLGGWNALEALEALRDSGLDVPLIVVTGSLGDEAAVHCMQRGAADYVLKERLERLPLAIRRALEEREIRARAAALQQALLRSKQHWETTFDTVPHPILVLDAECRIRRANRAAALLARCELPALIGAVCREAMGLAPQTCVDCPWTRMRRSRRPERGDVGVQGRIFDVSVTPYEGPGDLEDCAVQVMTDITARVAAESAVRDSEERYRLLFETNPHPMWVFEPESLCFLAVNDAAVRTYGYSRDEFRAMTLEALRNSADIPELHRQAAEARQRMASEHVLFSGATRHRRRDGSVIQVEATWSRTDFHGRPAVLVLAQDVTERVRAAAALRDSEERFRELFELAPIAYHEIDSGGIVRRVNHAECELLGRTAGEMLGRPEWERVVKEEREISRQAVVRKLARGEPDPPFRRRVWRPDGRTLLVENYEKVIRNTQGQVIGIRTALLDITEQERAGEALRRSEARLAEAQRRAHLGHWQRELSSNLMEWSEVIYDIYGVDPARFQPTLEAVQHMTHADDYPRVREAVTRALQTGEMQTVDHRIVRADGEERIVYVQMIVEREAGQPARLAGTIQDVTERRRAEEALRESEQRYRQIVETAGEGICLMDAEDRVSFVNQRLAEMLRCPAGELLGHPLCDWMDAGSRELARARCYEGPMDAGQNDFRFVRPDGTELWVLIAASPVFTREGSRAGTLAMLTDITERKQAEDALRKSEERFRELFENANDIVFTHDMDGCFTSFNKAGERITGYSRDELIGRGVREIVAPEHHELIGRMTRKKLEGASQTAYELEIISRDQRRVPLEISTRLIYEGGKPVGVQGIARDVTERRQLEDQLRQSQKMEAVGRLAGGIAHDFNNVLTVMKGYSDILLDANDLPDRLQRAADQIHKAADRASGMTRQLLAFSRRQVLQPSLLDLGEVVSNLQKMLHRLIGEDIQLTVALAGGLGAVRADRTQIEQVLMNLAVNARDAMPRGGTLVIETRNVEISGSGSRSPFAEAGQYVLLSVADTGCGMDPETQARIFEPFFTTKEVGKGTGLGLATVYGIVRQSGGFISVYSEPQNGTTFKIYLPRVEGRADAATETDATAVRGGSETVLLAEDETDVRRLVLSVLEARGYHVLEAESGTAAIQLSDSFAGEIHLLLTDVIMPRMSGTAAAAELSRRRPGLRVLFMSGYTDDAVMQQGTLPPGSGFLQKPFTSDVLARKVREVLDEPLLERVAS